MALIAAALTKLAALLLCWSSRFGAHEVAAAVPPADELGFHDFRQIRNHVQSQFVHQIMLHPGLDADNTALALAIQVQLVRIPESMARASQEGLKIHFPTGTFGVSFSAFVCESSAFVFAITFPTSATAECYSLEPPQECLEKGGVIGDRVEVTLSPDEVIRKRYVLMWTKPTTIIADMHDVVATVVKTCFESRDVIAALERNVLLYFGKAMSECVDAEIRLRPALREHRGVVVMPASHTGSRYQGFVYSEHLRPTAYRRFPLPAYTPDLVLAILP